MLPVPHHTTTRGNHRMNHRLLRLSLLVLAAPVLAWAQTPPTLDKIKQSGSMTLAYREASIPFSYLDDKAKPTGFGYEICEKIVDRVKAATGRADLQKKYQAVTSANRIPLLQNGTIDIECGSTTNNSERGKQVSFATNYFYTGTRFLVKAGTPVDQALRPRRQAGGLDHRHHQLPDHPPPQRGAEARHRAARRQGPCRVGADGADRPRGRLRDGRHPALRPEGERRRTRPSWRWWARRSRSSPTRS